MGYQSALEATGAKVKEFKEFGSCSGTWLAILDNGTVVEGSYGSCSGCDAFEAEFGWSEDQDSEAYTKKLESFGKQYLDNSESLQDIIARYQVKCGEDYAWEDDREILVWLRQVVV